MIHTDGCFVDQHLVADSGTTLRVSCVIANSNFFGEFIFDLSTSDLSFVLPFQEQPLAHSQLPAIAPLEPDLCCLSSCIDAHFPRIGEGHNNGTRDILRVALCSTKRFFLVLSKSV